MLDAHAAYTAHAEPIRRYIVRHIGPGQDADDVAGALWCEVVRRAGDYEDRGHPVSSWLYCLARSRIVDYQRRRSRYAWRLAPLREDMLSGDPRERIEAALDVQAHYRAAFDALTPGQRRVIVLRFLADYTIAETAARLGMTPMAVRAAQHRGLARLRGMYAD